MKPHWTTFVRGKKRQPGTMNKTEKAYSEYLDQRVWVKEVLWYKFEGIKLRLADSAIYTPDFCVLMASGYLELHEVKGFWAEAAKVRIKVAADMYPFIFKAYKKLSRKAGGGWEEETF